VTEADTWETGEGEADGPAIGARPNDGLGGAVNTLADRNGGPRMSRTRFTLVGAVTAVSMVAFAGGCGVLSSASTLAGLMSSIDANTTLGELLNQVTVGDLASLVQQLVSTFSADANSFRTADALTDDDLAEIESLQAQLEAGEITEQAFLEALREIIGDVGPRMGFGAMPPFGGPHGPCMGMEQRPSLDLTDEQQTEANQIFADAREDIDALFQDANDRIRALLTEEQLALLDEREPNLSSDGMRPPRHHGPPPPCPFLDDSLNLTDEQKTEIQAILDELQTAVSDRKEQATEAFLAILTEEQRAIVDEMKAAGPGPGPHGGRKGPPPHP